MRGDGLQWLLRGHGIDGENPPRQRRVHLHQCGLQLVVHLHIRERCREFSGGRGERPAKVEVHRRCAGNGRLLPEDGVKFFKVHLLHVELRFEWPCRIDGRFLRQREGDFGGARDEARLVGKEDELRDAQVRLRDRHRALCAKRACRGDELRDLCALACVPRLQRDGNRIVPAFEFQIDDVQRALAVDGSLGEFPASFPRHRRLSARDAREFCERHPVGKIGKRLEVAVGYCVEFA